MPLLDHQSRPDRTAPGACFTPQEGTRVDLLHTRLSPLHVVKALSGPELDARPPGFRHSSGLLLAQEGRESGAPICSALEGEAE